MLGPVALILAAASAGPAPLPAAQSPWWEKITYTLSEDGEAQSCRFESSRSGIESCDENGESQAPMRQASGPTTALTKITIERRFSPGPYPGSLSLESGDTLIGAKMMALSIANDGSVSSCVLVGTLGQMRTGYGCDQVRAERFDASARSGGTEPRRAFMTVLVYGHEEQLT